MTENLKLVHEKSQEIILQVGSVVLGKEDVIKNILIGMLANGHILLEDVPGVAKTLTASMFAQVLGLEFRRIQFLPDLLPGDLTGTYIYNPRQAEFEFRPGPLFANLVLADEINRGTPKTQSALLEAMQERQVTIEGQPFPLPQPFIVLATQNPIEFEGTYPLPEAQVDRFIMRLTIGYPDPEVEQAILAQRASRRQDTAQLSQVVTQEEFLAMQAALEDIYVSSEVQRYIVDIVTATRQDRRVQLGASPRGSLALFKLARARAAVEGRDFVLAQDVKVMARPALAHRLLLRAESWLERVTSDQVIDDILHRIPTPEAKGRSGGDDAQ